MNRIPSALAPRKDHPGLQLGRNKKAAQSAATLIHHQSLQLDYQKSHVTTRHQLDGNKNLQTSLTYTNLNLTHNQVTMYKDQTRNTFILESTTVNIEYTAIDISIPKDQDFKAPTSEDFANRIFNFAKNLANGDDSKIDLLEEAFEKGFQEAKSAFGGWLPDRCYETYDLVKEKFAEWREASTKEDLPD